MKMKKRINIRDMIYSALFVTLTAILGYISIPLPFSPIPITAQSLAVILAGCILTPLQSAISMTTFLLLGAIGVPVFSGGRAGIGIIVGKSGGFLVGFLVGAIIISCLVRINRSLINMIISCIIGGVVVVHFLGSTWLGYVTGIGMKKAFLVGSAPFIIGDLLKVAVAILIANRLKKGIIYEQ